MRDRGHFEDQPHTRGRGRAAEAEAEAWLKRRGYQVLERNVRNRGGEIDLVALEGATLCFIEVKARAGTSHGTAIEAVDGRKQRRIARAAALYLAATGDDRPCRFDVLAMDRRGEDWHFQLVRDAFGVG